MFRKYSIYCCHRSKNTSSFIMHTQLAVLCFLCVAIMVVVTADGNFCLLPLCGLRLGVYHFTLTRPGRPADYEVVTFHSDGFFSGIASNQASQFSSFEGTWKCTSVNTIEATDFLFNFASGTSPASISKGIFKLNLGLNNQVTGTLNATIFDLASTQNPDQSAWTQVFKLDFNVKGYPLLDRCII